MGEFLINNLLFIIYYIKPILFINYKVDKFKFFKSNISIIFIIFLILSKDVIFENYNIYSYKSHTKKNNDFQSNNTYVNTFENTTIINDSLYYIEYEITQTFFLNFTISLYSEKDDTKKIK